ncbi:MAG: tetratricopeptide repeat protein, partial [Nitrospirales bacterium]|nr:tetratricopeptide repeat protein [Nitrospirales bacterium]
MTKIIKVKHEDTEKEIQETLTDLKVRLQQKQRTLTYAAGAFVLVVGTIVGVSIYLGTAKTKAMDKAAEGYSLFYGDFQNKFLSPGERYTKALAGFKESYNARKSPYALFYEAAASYELGDYDKCIKDLKELTNQTSDSKLLSLSYYKLAMAYMKKQDFKNAASTLTTITTIKDGSLQDMALLEIGKVAELTGRFDEAKKYYNDM